MRCGRPSGHARPRRDHEHRDAGPQPSPQRRRVEWPRAASVVPNGPMHVALPAPDRCDATSDRLSALPSTVMLGARLRRRSRRDTDGAPPLRGCQ